MRYVTASDIFDGIAFLPENTVLVLSDDLLIIDIVSINSVDSSNLERYEGILCPGFINAHCHLELSHLKNIIPKHTGIVDFGLSVIKNRNVISQEEQLECMRQADEEMQCEGIVAVGDISNTNLSIPVKKTSSIYYHTFIELIALNPSRADAVFRVGLDLLNSYQNSGLRASLAPHAPYSTSVELIKIISDYCVSPLMPTTIHNQESKAEEEFFMIKKGDYLKLYDTLNLDISYFIATNQSSLKSYISFMNPNVNTIMVHNTFSDKSDIENANQRHTHLYWCFCPNANLYIEDALPNLNLFSSLTEKLLIGTDSLASNHRLSIIEEINILQQKFPDISINNWLQAATFNGAKALGIEDKFGLITVGKKSGLNLISGVSGKMKVKVLT